MSVEPALRRISHDDGREAILEPRVMQVLVALARAEGRILSRDDLSLSCWPGVVVSEDALNRVIGRLRRVADAMGEFHIVTITKVGYRLTLARPLSPSAGREESAKPSICVLPFANMSDDPQQEYFSDGITEDIITDLSKV
ncbi:MAG: winged helix-turn-helix domain-containing protein, partial [Caulobacteraceae bacterium]